MYFNSFFSPIAVATVLTVTPVFAQCANGVCSYGYAPKVIVRQSEARFYCASNRVSASRLINYWGSPRNVLRARSIGVSEYVPEPCEPVAKTVPEPCAPVETVQPCEPVETTVPEPCEPVQTVEPCNPVSDTCEGCDQFRDVTNMAQVGECVGGACPIRRIVGGAVDAVQTVAATARFLAAANALRARYGLAPLQADVGLDAACKGQVGICARRGALVHGAGAPEILAQNTSGFEFAVSQWAASRSGHAELLLNPSFRFAGVAMERDAYGRCWCAMRFR